MFAFSEDVDNTIAALITHAMPVHFKPENRVDSFLITGDGNTELASWMEEVIRFSESATTFLLDDKKSEIALAEHIKSGNYTVVFATTDQPVGLSTVTDKLKRSLQYRKFAESETSTVSLEQTFFVIALKKKPDEFLAKKCKSIRVDGVKKHSPLNDAETAAALVNIISRVGADYLPKQMIANGYNTPPSVSQYINTLSLPSASNMTVRKKPKAEVASRLENISSFDLSTIPSPNLSSREVKLAMAIGALAVSVDASRRVDTWDIFELISDASMLLNK